MANKPENYNFINCLDSCFAAVINHNKVDEINLPAFNDLIDATCNFCGKSCSSDDELIYQVERVLLNLTEKIIPYIVDEYESIPKWDTKQEGKRKTITGDFYSAVALHLYTNEGMKSKIEPGFISYNESSYSIENNYSDLPSLSFSNIISIFMFINPTDNIFFPTRYCLTYMDNNFYKDKPKELAEFIDYARTQKKFSDTTDPTIKARIFKLLRLINNKLIEYMKGKSVGVESTFISKETEDFHRNIRLSQDLITDKFNKISLVLNKQILPMKNFFGLKGRYILASPPQSGKSKFAKRIQDLDKKYLIINSENLVFENDNSIQQSLASEVKKQRNHFLPTLHKDVFEKEISKFMLIFDNWDVLSTKQRKFTLNYLHNIPNFIILTTNFFPEEFKYLVTQTIEIDPLDSYLDVYIKLKMEINKEAYLYNGFLEDLSFARFYGGLEYILDNYSINGDNIDEIVSGYFNLIAPAISRLDKNAYESLEKILLKTFEQKLKISHFSDLIDKDISKRQENFRKFEKFISDNKFPFIDTYSLYDSDFTPYYSKIIRASDGFISFQYVEFLWLFAAKILMSDSEKNISAIQNGYEICGSTQMWNFFMSYFGIKIEEQPKSDATILVESFGKSSRK